MFVSLANFDVVIVPADDRVYAYIAPTVVPAPIPQSRSPGGMLFHLVVPLGGEEFVKWLGGIDGARILRECRRRAGTAKRCARAHTIDRYIDSLFAQV